MNEMNETKYKKRKILQYLCQVLCGACEFTKT